MKTLLIVEDEKMIRQGIKTMVQRSGVPVEVIIECNNGETALEIIREQKIDVMFTDIRMPKMDGIELVKRMQECEHVPITVAISGYDDFSYAVEMLRNGVREYLLKPIEREQIADILKKLNEEIESQREQQATQRQIGYQQIKHMLMSDNMAEEELVALEKQYAKQAGNQLADAEYYVCCRNSSKREVQVQECIYLDRVERNDIYIVPCAVLDTLLQKEFSEAYVGISGIHKGIRQLKPAYEEAVSMRRIAYMRNRNLQYCDSEAERIPENLIAEAQKLLTEGSNMQRVQLLGTERAEELAKSFKQFFFVARNGRITPQQYEECLKQFFAEVEKTYTSALANVEELLKECKDIWSVDCVDLYEEKLMEFVVLLQEKMNHQFDVNKNTQKMRSAIDYIETHYADDLNMAVVSNYISMNYSLFSYSFKQYTGSNFVNYLKDIRMREAKKLLTETELKIIEISQTVGYDNEKHFMKLFKNTYGVSPTEYRKNMSRAKG